LVKAALVRVASTRAVTEEDLELVIATPMLVVITLDVAETKDELVAAAVAEIKAARSINTIPRSSF
jgi:hypothetical protein